MIYIQNPIIPKLKKAVKEELRIELFDKDYVPINFSNTIEENLKIEDIACDEPAQTNTYNLNLSIAPLN